jgi:galactokinase
MPLQERVSQEFRQRFGAQPTFLVRAPGRVNLIGEHTDYNDGFVLPMAIDRAIWIALRPRADGRVMAYSLDFPQPAAFDLDAFAHEGHGWDEYVKGVAWALQDAGHGLEGWEGIVGGDVPVGSGLSSSAALELATARAFAAVSGLPWDAATMARLGQRAENQWVGMNCGIMDQLISAAGLAGHAMLMDCRSLETTPLPMPPALRVVVLDSAAPRELAGSAYNQRRAQCEAAVAKLQVAYPGIRALRDVSPAMLAAEEHRLDQVERRRARHVVSENDRVLRFAAALQSGETDELGTLLLASHASLRDDYQVSSPELDTLVELAMETPGVLGARLTGAGFGGCAIALTKEDGADSAATSIVERYRRATGRPGQGYVTVPSQGAELLAPAR